MNVNKTTPYCGAEVTGIDLSQPLSERQTEELSQALAEHCVLFFRNQSLTASQQKDLGGRFGPLHLHQAWPRLVDGHPEVMELLTDENSTHIAGEDWHSDVSCDLKPPLGTILQMLEAPPTGGDTLFASMYAAYESLSASMQQFLSTLTAVHDGEPFYRGRYREDDRDYDYPQAIHPLIRTHPVSGRPALFVNRIFTTRICELSEIESDSLLQMLFRLAVRPEFQCRFRWTPGAIAFWDNRCAQHKALWDYYPQRRRAWRVTIEGDAPFFTP